MRAHKRTPEVERPTLAPDRRSTIPPLAEGKAMECGRTLSAIKETGSKASGAMTRASGEGRACQR